MGLDEQPSIKARFDLVLGYSERMEDVEYIS